MRRLDPARSALRLLNSRVAPPVASALQSEQAGAIGAIKARSQRALAGQIEGMSRRVWHLVNLPAASDVNRLLRQIAQVERQVRDLRNEITDQRVEHSDAAGV